MLLLHIPHLGHSATSLGLFDGCSRSDPSDLRAVVGSYSPSPTFSPSSKTFLSSPATSFSTDLVPDQSQPEIQKTCSGSGLQKHNEGCSQHNAPQKLVWSLPPMKNHGSPPANHPRKAQLHSDWARKNGSSDKHKKMVLVHQNFWFDSSIWSTTHRMAVLTVIFLKAHDHRTFWITQSLRLTSTFFGQPWWHCPRWMLALRITGFFPWINHLVAS